MGSLASRPKVPRVQQQPQIVYVPTPVTATPSSSATETQTSEPTQSERQSELRQQNLLTRSRGRFGTVTTSFRGLLSSVNNAGQSKTLLGE